MKGNNHPTIATPDARHKTCKLTLGTRLSEAIQAKIRHAVEQGHIDAEDFRGDPAYNHPGSRGIRGRKVKRKGDPEGDDDGSGAEEVQFPFTIVQLWRWC